jgi:hypothetical protein
MRYATPEGIALTIEFDVDGQTYIDMWQAARQRLTAFAPEVAWTDWRLSMTVTPTAQRVDGMTMMWTGHVEARV